jgi:SWI/SNF-related matrix-associated actin-dependent regulator 1 of chromatin subfamily A
VLVANIQSANMGITLTRADTVVFVERDWTPAVEEQAEDRVNRIGQDADVVHAVYMCVENTIDERFSRIVSQKREVIRGVLDGGAPEERKSLATELLMGMVDAGDIPASMLSDFVGKGPSRYKGTTKEW